MEAFDEQEWYDEPKFYDIVYDVDTDKEADFIEALCERYVRSPGKSALEPACGSGRLVAALAARGFRAVGFDRNPRMLAYARARLSLLGLAAEVKQMDMSRFRLGAERFDIAHCLVSSFRHLAEEEDAKRHLRCIADTLRTGGIYALGLLLTDYGDRALTFERFDEERDGIRVQCHHTTFPASRRRRSAVMRARMTVTERGAVKKFESSWTSRTYGPRQLKAFLATEPRLELVGVHDFDYAVDKRSLLEDDRLDKVVVLRKRAR